MTGTLAIHHDITPGPWVSVRGNFPRTVSMKRDYWEVGQLHDPNSGIAFAFRSEGIAATPDLYTALEQAFLALGTLGANADINHPGRKAWEAARAALSKADGRPA